MNMKSLIHLVWPDLEAAAGIARGLERAAYIGSCSGLTVDELICYSHLPLAWFQASRKVLKAFAQEGLVDNTGIDEWRPCSNVNYALIAAYLEGARIAHSHHEQLMEPRLIVNFPDHLDELWASARSLAPELKKLGTEDLFKHIANRARYQVTVITPFYDEAGLELMERVARHQLAPGVKLELISRNSKDHPMEFLHHHWKDLADRLHVFDYHHPGPAGQSELSHAKALLSDDQYVYIGSANLTKASLSISQELGVYLEGDIARQVRAIAEAMKESASGCHKPKMSTS